MNSMTDKTKTRSELKREAIIEAAKYAFKEYGVQATSMDKLADIARVSKRTVYNHFSSKEELVMYLVSDLWQKAVANVAFDYQANTSLKTQLMTWVNYEIDLICTQEYLDLSRVAIGHLFYNLSALQKEMEKLAGQTTSLQKWLKDATEDGRLMVKDVEHASFQLHSLIEGSCFWPQLTGCKALLTEQEKQFVADETVKMFLARYQTTK